MRRLLSLLLMATLGMPLWAPLLALAQGPEATLPICCRRDGRHQCAMGMAEQAKKSAIDSHTPRWKAPLEKCPYDPAAVGVSYQHPVGSTAARPAMFGAFFAAPLGPVQTESRRRMARDRSRQKRGPPFHSLT